MFNLIWADLFKLRKSFAIKVLFGITMLSAVAMTIIAYLIPRGKLEVGMTGIGFMFSDVNIISILGAVIAGVFICGDFDNKIIHDAIANGSSRSAVIVSKAVVFYCAIAFMLLPYVIITGYALSTGNEFSMGTIAVGLLHILTIDSGISITALEIWKLLFVILTLMFVYMAQLSVCVPLAFTLKRPVFVVAIYYGFTILCAQLLGLRDSSRLLDRILALTPFGGNYTFMSMETVTGDIIKSFFVSLVFMFIMLTVTYIVFRRSEIK